MDRKNFLRKGLSGAGLLVTSSFSGIFFTNNNDELRDNKVLGFNYIPNTKPII